MQKSVIYFKRTLPEKVIQLLVSISNDAFNNREGKIVGNRESTYCLSYGGDESMYGCLQLGMLKMTVIAGAIGGLIVLAITPFVLRFATLNDTAMHYLKYMLLINTYYIMGAAVNTALIAGVFRAGGDTKFGLICDTIDMWCYAIPLGFFAAFVLKLPVLWVYFLLCTDEFVKWPWVIKHYREGKWAKNITREEV